MTARVLLTATAAAALTVAASPVVCPASAWAAPEFVQRHITLPRGTAALDFGLGLGHDGDRPSGSQTGLGLNLELAVGVLWNLELGVRTGMRFDDGAAGATHASEYGRIFKTETYGVNADRFANPEVRLTWELARGGVLDLALDWRVYLPTEDGSHVGFMFAMPLALHLGRAVRFDTGFYAPIIPEHWSAVSVPLHLWLQVSSRVWTGVLFGVRWVHDAHTELPLGFGLGVALARAVDLKSWIYFPDVNETAGAQLFGAGVGLQLRID